MKSLVAQVALYALVFSGAHVALLCHKELLQYRLNQADQRVIPLDGSLSGVDVRGQVQQLTQGSQHATGKPTNILLFVLHHEHGQEEVNYWNTILQQVAQDGGTQHLYVWAVCDSGTACLPEQAAARFLIMSYLDPYQMRACANADARHVAILYDASYTVKTLLGITENATLEAKQLQYWTTQ